MRDDEIHAAIRKLDAQPILDWASAPAFGDKDRWSLLGRLLRSSSLINARRSKSQSGRRKAFATDLRAGYEAFGEPWADAFDAVMRQLDLAEEGYRRILAALAASDYAKLTPGTRIWSALYRPIEEAIITRQQLVEHLAGQKAVMAQALSLRDDQDRPVSVDAIMDAFVESASASLNIEGRTERWVGTDGVITIPVRVDVPEEARIQAGSNQYLSIAWRNWRALEERVRFLGGHLEQRRGADLPNGFPDAADELFEAVGVPDLFEIWVGQHRLNDSDTQTYLQTLNRPDIKARMAQYGQNARLVPDAWISHEEAVAFSKLAGVLGQAVVDPAVKIEGLTIPEWLRGMAVLSAVVAGPIRNNLADAELWLPSFEPSELKVQMVQNGLADASADRLIDQMRFRTSSVDLYDAPLIQSADGKLTGFGPALYGPNHAGILLSIFSAKDVDLSDKGTEFEEKVLSLLLEEGLNASGYKTSLRKETSGAADEYEFDVLLMWDDYLFVFECKNRSLPQDNAVRTYNFLRETSKQVRQVQRLCDALRAHPEWVEAALGQPVGERKIVPVVLNNLPFARKGDTDGVYFYDYQALNRFFDSRALGFKSGSYDRAEPTGQMDVVKIWRGPTPTAEDLMRQLIDPVQLHFNREQTRSGLFTYQLDATTFAAEPRLYREDMTPDIAARIAGVPRHVMRARERKLLKRAAKVARRTGGRTPIRP